MPTPIKIQVLETDGPEGAAGTFLYPPSLVRINKNKDAKVHWHLINKDAQFVVRFKTTSAFPGPPATITDENDRDATISGPHTYSVTVTKNDGSYTWMVDPILCVVP